MSNIRKFVVLFHLMRHFLTFFFRCAKYLVHTSTLLKDDRHPFSLNTTSLYSIFVLNFRKRRIMCRLTYRKSIFCFFDQSKTRGIRIFVIHPKTSFNSTMPNLGDPHFIVDFFFSKNDCVFFFSKLTTMVTIDDDG